MNKGVLVVSIVSLVTLGFSGCFGDDDPPGGGVLKASFTVSQIGEETFRFDASGSSGRIATYAWDFGDAEEAEGKVVEHTYTYGSGVYEARLVVTDRSETTDMRSVDVVVGDGVNLPPTADFRPSARYVALGDPFRVDASSSTDPEGDRLRYEWDFNHLMQERDYKTFRERKSTATADDGSTATEGQEGSGSSGAGTDVGRLVSGPTAGKEDAGHCHGPCSPEQGNLGWDGRRSQWDDPVFDLVEGFPSEGAYYIKLTVYDVKGASQEYLSEQVWPVEVAADPAPRVVHNYDAPITGNLTAAAPAAVADNTDDEGAYADQANRSFELDHRVHRIFINVTFTKTGDGVDGPVPNLNDVRMKVTLPSKDVRTTSGSGTTVDGKLVRSINVTEDQDPGKGQWKVDLEATTGAGIRYEITYWAERDLTPEVFAEIEAPYR